jgi:3-isopropylmalate/(R)-2-methylmalate dehydratase small subunit
VNDNFGCGSSREHAPQALMRWGIRALVGVSFAEIFYGNCLALGIPCAKASQDEVRALQDAMSQDPAVTWSFDLETSSCSSDLGHWSIDVDPGPRDMLLSGRWDATGQLLARDAELQSTLDRLPYLNGFCTDAADT